MTERAYDEGAVAGESPTAQPRALALVDAPGSSVPLLTVSPRRSPLVAGRRPAGRARRRQEADTQAGEGARRRHLLPALRAEPRGRGGDQVPAAAARRAGRGGAAGRAARRGGARDPPAEGGGRVAAGRVRRAQQLVGAAAGRWRGGAAAAGFRPGALGLGGGHRADGARGAAGAGGEGQRGRDGHAAPVHRRHGDQAGADGARLRDAAREPGGRDGAARSRARGGHGAAGGPAGGAGGAAAGARVREHGGALDRADLEQRDAVLLQHQDEAVHMGAPARLSRRREAAAAQHGRGAGAAGGFRCLDGRRDHPPVRRAPPPACPETTHPPTASC